MVLQQLVDAKVEATRREAKLLCEAMLGRADAPGSFGFFGDMGAGRSPSRNCSGPPRNPALHDGDVPQRRHGLEGPVHQRRRLGRRRPEGRVRAPYRGASLGQVSSAGPDGLFDTADDIVYPPARPNPGGRLMVTVKRMAAEDSSYTLDPAGYTVRLYYSSNGQEAILDDPVARSSSKTSPGHPCHRRPEDEIGPASGRGARHDPGVRQRRHEARGIHLPAVAAPACYTRSFAPGRNRPAVLPSFMH